jgi:hypothetical protein
MGMFGFGRTEIRYDMFDIARSAVEAKRFARCERIYHVGQELAWDGQDILPMLMAQHGGIRLEGEKREAVKRIFAMIMWGELAAWKISAQLADRLVPLEAKLAATSQAHDEARHFYVMHDYLCQLGYVPARMDRAPQALLDLVLETDHLAYKLLGMQLMIETMALGIFQVTRESQVEPVLCELLKYFERDEARHVGLGLQYLPDLLKQMNGPQVLAMSAFQVRLMTYALWENKELDADMRTLGINPRGLIENARRKQIAAMQAAWQAVDIRFDRDDNLISRSVNAAVELFFPWSKDTALSERARTAYTALRRRGSERMGMGEFEDHERHRIKTARGVWTANERDVAAE